VRGVLNDLLRKEVGKKHEKEESIVNVARGDTIVSGAVLGLVPYSKETNAPQEGPSKGQQGKEIGRDCDSQIMLDSRSRRDEINRGCHVKEEPIRE
jgi:hypothetical protein